MLLGGNMATSLLYETFAFKFIILVVLVAIHHSYPTFIFYFIYVVVDGHWSQTSFFQTTKGSTTPLQPTTERYVNLATTTWQFLAPFSGI